MRRFSPEEVVQCTLETWCNFIAFVNVGVGLVSGRVNLVELQELLNVDLSHIESKVHEIVRTESSLNLVLGQIVSE